MKTENSKSKLLQIIHRSISARSLLILIMVLAAVLRLWKLGSIPPSLSPDEASLGYNAYSILKTGRDEYGKILPIVFRSFGDYKPGLYIYTTLPFVTVFGLNEWSVRLPSAIAGIISVWLIFLIIKSLAIISSLKIENLKLEIITAFTAAINPWLIFFSRGAWEANLSLTLTLGGIYFLLRSLKKPTIYNVLPTTLLFSITLWTYQGAKLSTFIVVLCIIIAYSKEIKEIWMSSKKTIITTGIIALTISLPIIFSFFNGQTGRLKVYSVFNYPRPQEYLHNMLSEGNEKIGDINYILFHTESYNFLRGIAGRWFNHFSGRFLFFEGDYQNPMHSAPNHGMFLLIDLFLLPLGFVFFINSKILNLKFKVFVLLLLILSPLPAALSRDQVQSVRALNMALPLVILISFCVYYLYLVFSKNRFRLPFYYLLSTIYLVSFVYFIDSYFIHFPIHNAKYWHYGFKQAVETITPIQNNYDTVIFQQSYSQPYIYFLFYQKYDPLKYQKTANLVTRGPDVGLVENLDNISFEGFSWPPGIHQEKTLVTGNPIGIPPYFSTKEYTLIKDIKYPDGYETAIRILEKNPDY